eukprot:gene39459-biopygen26363
MAEQSSGSGATPWLAFMVGGLVVVAAIIGFMMYSGQSLLPHRTVEVKIAAPQIPDAPKLPDAPLPKPQ